MPKSASELEETAAFEKKQRRLNIAGWTLVASGVAFPVVVAPLAATKETNCDPLECPVYGIAVTSYLLGPIMVITGATLLLRRRGRRKERDRRVDVVAYPGAMGAGIAGRF